MLNSLFFEGCLAGEEGPLVVPDAFGLRVMFMEFKGNIKKILFSGRQRLTNFLRWIRKVLHPVNIIQIHKLRDRVNLLFEKAISKRGGTH